MDAVFDGLASFLEHALEEDQHFVIFPYTLSDYSNLEDLPTPNEEHCWRTLTIGSNISPR